MRDLRKISEMGREISNATYEYLGISKEDQKCISLYIEKFPNGKYKMTGVTVISESTLDDFATTWEKTLEKLKKLEEEES